MMFYGEGREEGCRGDDEDGAALVGVKGGCRGEEKIVVGLMVMMFVRL